MRMKIKLSSRISNKKQEFSLIMKKIKIKI